MVVRALRDDNAVLDKLFGQQKVYTWQQDQKDTKGKRYESLFYWLDKLNALLKGC